MIIDTKLNKKIELCLSVLKELTRKCRIIFRNKSIVLPQLNISNRGVACYYPNKQIIEINKKILDLNSDYKIKQILTHEFCHHTMFYIDKGKSTHGKLFNECCLILGIPKGPNVVVRTKKGERIK